MKYFPAPLGHIDEREFRELLNILYPNMSRRMQQSTMAQIRHLFDHDDKLMVCALTRIESRAPDIPRLQMQPNFSFDAGGAFHRRHDPRVQYNSGECAHGISICEVVVGHGSYAL
jgi:hypothetical protein